MSEQELNGPQINALGQPATGGFVPEVVPMEVNLDHLLTVRLIAQESSVLSVALVVSAALVSLCGL